MRLFLDSFWRALAYCLHPRVILWSLLPLLLLVVTALALSHLYWDLALDQLRALLDESAMVTAVWDWLRSVGLGGLKEIAAPLLLIFAVTPLLVVMTLLIVAVATTPAMVMLVAARRFPALEKKQGSSFLGSLVWTLLSTVVALIALVVSVPLWLIPPLILVLPPLIWGWLTYRVMSFDVLATHASKDERRQIMRSHKGWLLAMGVLTGYAGLLPSVAWISGPMFAAAFVLLVPLAIWIYTLVFAFSSLWFAHFCLAALVALRKVEQGHAVVVESPSGTVAPTVGLPPAPSTPPALPGVSTTSE